MRVSQQFYDRLHLRVKCLRLLRVGYTNNFTIGYTDSLE